MHDSSISRTSFFPFVAFASFPHFSSTPVAFRARGAQHHLPLFTLPGRGYGAVSRSPSAMPLGFGNRYSIGHDADRLTGQYRIYL